MASNYLDKKIEEINKKYNALIYDEERRVDNLKSQLSSLKPISSYIKTYGLIGFVIWIYIDVLTCAIGFIVGAIIGVIIRNIKVNSNDADIRNHVSDKEKKIKDLNELRYNEIKAVTDEFKLKCSSHAVKYAKSPHIDIVVDWLYDYFERKIKAADRQVHLQQISIPLIFEVKNDCIESEQGKFDFVVRRFKNFGSVEECVGFAEALTKLLYVKLMKNYPVDITGTKVSIDVNHNDANVMIKYTAKNGNFKHLVSF